MKKTELPNIHQLIMDENKIEKIKAYYNFLIQMNNLGHNHPNREQFWTGSLDSLETIIEILDIKGYLGE